MILILVKLFLWPLSHPTDRRRPFSSLACQLHRGGHFKRKRKKYHYTFSSRKLDCSTKRPALKSTKYRQNVRIASFGLVIMFFNISSNKKPSNLHFLGPKVPFSFKSSQNRVTFPYFKLHSNPKEEIVDDLSDEKELLNEKLATTNEVLLFSHLSSSGQETDRLEPLIHVSRGVEKKHILFICRQVITNNFDATFYTLCHVLATAFESPISR